MDRRRPHGRVVDHGNQSHVHVNPHSVDDGEPDRGDADEHIPDAEGIPKTS